MAQSNTFDRRLKHKPGVERAHSSNISFYSTLISTDNFFSFEVFSTLLTWLQHF